jgi:DNA-directed RNA polymerase subunit RPC12/RpoP
MATQTANRQVLLCNGDTENYITKYQDDEYVIPAKGSIKLPRRLAIAIKGQYGGLNKEGGLKMQMLTIEEIEGVTGAPKVTEFPCMRCGKSFPTKVELEKHSEIHAHEVIKDTEAEERIEEKTTIKCPLCEKRFDTKNGLSVHLRSCKGEINANTSTGTDKL